LFNSCYGENSIRIGENVLNFFPARVYVGLVDLAEIIINLANCNSSKITVVEIDKTDFGITDALCVYADIIKPNFFGDS